MSIIYNNFSNALTAQDKSFAQPVCRKSHLFDTFTAVSKQPRTMNSGIERRLFIALDDGFDSVVKFRFFKVHAIPASYSYQR